MVSACFYFHCGHSLQYLKDAMRQVKLKHQICVRGSLDLAGWHFNLIFGIFCSFLHDEAGIFKCFCFIWKLWISWGWCQLQFLNLPTSWCHHAGGAMLSLYDSLQPSVFKFILKNVKTVVQSCKLLKSLSKRPWGNSKEIYYFSLPDEGGENKIHQFLSFFLFIV